MPGECEIILEHGGPVSFDALHEAIELIRDASEGAAIQLLRSGTVAELNLSGDLLTAAMAAVRTESPHSFWLASVEPGSSKFKGTVSGFILRIFAAAVSATAGHIAFDVIQQTETYQELRPHLVELTDQYTDLLVEQLRARTSDRKPPEQLALIVEPVGDRLRIVILPSRRQLEYVSLG
jgi:hypothetical protein